MDYILELVRAMHDNFTLQKKSLKGFICTVNGDDEAKDSAQELVEYPQVLENNNIMISSDTSLISDAGAGALAQALHHNCTLERLDLYISDAGTIALAQALHHNSTLERLDLSVLVMLEQ